ncbi:unnamed protein product [Prunus armeniaca]
MAKGFFNGEQRSTMARDEFFDVLRCRQWQRASSMEVGVNGMGCAMECVCKRREFSVGCGWISDGVGFDFRWGVTEREGGFRWVVREWGL